MKRQRPYRVARTIFTLVILVDALAGARGRAPNAARASHERNPRQFDFEDELVMATGAPPAHAAPSPGTPAGSGTHLGAQPSAARAIRDAVRSRFDAVRLCYESLLQRAPGSEGRVTVRFVVAHDLTIANPTPASADAGVRTAAGCVARALDHAPVALGTWTGPILVNYPFMLSF